MPMPVVRGPRPTATRTFSASFSTVFPAAVVHATFTPACIFSIFVTVHDVFTSMPRFLNRRVSSFEMSSSSTGTARGKNSTMVTSDAEAAEDGAELHAHGTGADDDERFGRLGQRENFDVGQDAVIGLLRPNSVRAKEPVARMMFFALSWVCSPVAGFEIDGVDAVFRGSREPAESRDHRDLVLLHQEFEALGVLVHDVGFALLDRGPVELRSADHSPIDAVFRRVLQVVPDFGVEQQRLGGDAAHVQAGATEHRVALDEGDLEAELAAANGRGVTRGAAAYDGHVVNDFCQGNAPFRRDKGRPRDACHGSV